MSQDKRTQAVLQSFRCTRLFNSHDSSTAHEFVICVFQALADFKATKKTLGSNGNLWSLMVFLMVSDSLEKNLPRLGDFGEIWWRWWTWTAGHVSSMVLSSELWVSVKIPGHLWLPRMSLAEVLTSRHGHVSDLGCIHLSRVTRMWSSWSIILFRLPLRSIVISLLGVKGDKYATNLPCCSFWVSLIYFDLLMFRSLYPSPACFLAVHQFLGSLCSTVKEYTHRIGRTGRAGKKGGGNAARAVLFDKMFDKMFLWGVNMFKLNRWNDEISRHFL